MDFIYIFFVYNAKGRRKTQKEKQNAKKGLLSRKESPSGVDPNEIQEVIQRGGMVEQLSIRRSSKLGHEIRTLITFPKSVVNIDIILLHQIFHILNQNHVDMKTQIKTLKDFTYIEVRQCI